MHEVIRGQHGGVSLHLYVGSGYQIQVIRLPLSSGRHLYMLSHLTSHEMLWPLERQFADPSAE